MIRFFIFLLFCSNVLANSHSELSNLLNKMNSLTGNFKQKVIDQNGAILQEVSGQFFFKKQYNFCLMLARLVSSSSRLVIDYKYI